MDWVSRKLKLGRTETQATAPQLPPRNIANTNSSSGGSGEIQNSKTSNTALGSSKSNNNGSGSNTTNHDNKSSNDINIKENIEHPNWRNFKQEAVEINKLSSKQIKAARLNQLASTIAQEENEIFQVISEDMTSVINYILKHFITYLNVEQDNTSQNSIQEQWYDILPRYEPMLRLATKLLNFEKEELHHLVIKFNIHGQLLNFLKSFANDWNKLFLTNSGKQSMVIAMSTCLPAVHTFFQALGKTNIFRASELDGLLTKTLPKSDKHDQKVLELIKSTALHYIIGLDTRYLDINNWSDQELESIFNYDISLLGESVDSYSLEFALTVMSSIVKLLDISQQRSTNLMQLFITQHGKDLFSSFVYMIKLETPDHVKKGYLTTLNQLISIGGDEPMQDIEDSPLNTDFQIPNLNLLSPYIRSKSFLQIHMDILNNAGYTLPKTRTTYDPLHIAEPDAYLEMQCFLMTSLLKRFASQPIDFLVCYENNLFSKNIQNFDQIDHQLQSLLLKIFHLGITQVKYVPIKELSILISYIQSDTVQFSTKRQIWRFLVDVAETLPNESRNVLADLGIFHLAMDQLKLIDGQLSGLPDEIINLLVFQIRILSLLVEDDENLLLLSSNVDIQSLIGLLSSDMLRLASLNLISKLVRVITITKCQFAQASISGISKIKNENNNSDTTQNNHDAFILLIDAFKKARSPLIISDIAKTIYDVVKTHHSLKLRIPVEIFVTKMLLLDNSVSTTNHEENTIRQMISCIGLLMFTLLQETPNVTLKLTQSFEKIAIDWQLPSNQGSKHHVTSNTCTLSWVSAGIQEFLINVLFSLTIGLSCPNENQLSLYPLIEYRSHILLEGSFSLAWCILLDRKSPLQNIETYLSVAREMMFFSTENILKINSSTFPLLMLHLLFDMKMLINRDLEQTIQESLYSLFKVGITDSVFRKLSEMWLRNKDSSQNDKIHDFLSHCIENGISPSYLEFNIKIESQTYLKINDFGRIFPPANGYTFMCWFRLHKMQDDSVDIPIFTILDDEDKVRLSLKINSKELTLQTLKSTVSVKKSTLFIPRHWHHVAIVHEKPKLTASHVNIYVDGQLIETRLKCPYLGHPGSAKQVKSYFGVPENQKSSLPNYTWHMASSYFLEEVLLQKAYIEKIYNLGHFYSGLFDSLEHETNHSSTTTNNLTVASYGQNSSEVSSKNLSIQLNSTSAAAAAAVAAISPLTKLIPTRAAWVEIVPQETILIAVLPKNHVEVLFANYPTKNDAQPPSIHLIDAHANAIINPIIIQDSSSNNNGGSTQSTTLQPPFRQQQQQLHHQQTPNVTELGSNISQKDLSKNNLYWDNPSKLPLGPNIVHVKGDIHVLHFNTVIDYIWKWGGNMLLLEWIDRTQSQDQLYQAVSLFVNIINKSPRLREEMENGNQHDLLAHILRTKQQLMSLPIFDSILGLVCQSSNQGNMIAYPHSYQCLFLDPSVWATSSEMKTYYVNHFNELIFHSDKKYENAACLLKLGFFRNMIFWISTKVFSDSPLAELFIIAKALLKINPSSDAIKVIFSYLTSTLPTDRSSNEFPKDHQFISDPKMVPASTAEIKTRHTFMEIIYDLTVDVPSIIPIVLKAASIRWAVMLMESHLHPYTVVLSTRLFTKLLYYNDNSLVLLKLQETFILISKLMMDQGNNGHLLLSWTACFLGVDLSPTLPEGKAIDVLQATKKLRERPAKSICAPILTIIVEMLKSSIQCLLRRKYLSKEDVPRVELTQVVVDLLSDLYTKRDDMKSAMYASNIVESIMLMLKDLHFQDKLLSNENGISPSAVTAPNLSSSSTKASPLSATSPAPAEDFETFTHALKKEVLSLLMKIAKESCFGVGINPLKQLQVIFRGIPNLDQAGHEQLHGYISVELMHSIQNSVLSGDISMKTGGNLVKFMSMMVDHLFQGHHQIDLNEVTSFVCNVTDAFVHTLPDQSQLIVSLFKQTNRFILYSLAIYSGMQDNSLNKNQKEIHRYLETCLNLQSVIFSTKNQDIEFLKAFFYELWQFKDMEDPLVRHALYSMWKLLVLQRANVLSILFKDVKGVEQVVFIDLYSRILEIDPEKFFDHLNMHAESLTVFCKASLLKSREYLLASSFASAQENQKSSLLAREIRKKKVSKRSSLQMETLRLYLIKVSTWIHHSRFLEHEKVVKMREDEKSVQNYTQERWKSVSEELARIWVIGNLFEDAQDQSVWKLNFHESVSRMHKRLSLNKGPKPVYENKADKMSKNTSHANNDINNNSIFNGNNDEVAYETTSTQHNDIQGLKVDIIISPSSTEGHQKPEIDTNLITRSEMNTSSLKQLSLSPETNFEMLDLPDDYEKEMGQIDDEEDNVAIQDDDEFVVLDDKEITQSKQATTINEQAENQDAIANNEDKNENKILRMLETGDTIQESLNCSRILALDMIDGLLVFGEEHTYFVQQFIKTELGEYVDIDYLSPSERKMYGLSLIASAQPTNSNVSGAAGTSKHTNVNNDDTSSSITSQQPKIRVDTKPSATTSSSAERYRCRKFNNNHVNEIYHRQFLLRDVALEIFLNDGQSFFFNFLNTTVRNQVSSKLLARMSSRRMTENEEDAVKLIQLEDNSRLRYQFFGVSPLQDLTDKWCNREISNFEYLIKLNTLAGRTYNDLTQYPVFPWIIKDYSSEALDLNNPEIYRDLSKPMGAQGQQRANKFLDRFQVFAETPDADGTPPSHYAVHYSSAMIVCSYLIRMEPFTQQYIKLQGGYFDHPDRLFQSIEHAFKSASELNMGDVRELIPEFYYLPEFLENRNKFNFGINQKGQALNHVHLPVWAKNNPRLFVEIHRRALESEFVSQHIHEWIDLIFGYKQTGEEAKKALNLFHYLSYEGAVNIEAIQDPIQKEATIAVINNFGQTPRQLFKKPHPKRGPPRESIKCSLMDHAHLLKQAIAPVSKAKKHQLIQKMWQKDNKIYGMSLNQSITRNEASVLQMVEYEALGNRLVLKGVDSNKPLVVQENIQHIASIQHVMSIKEDQFITSAGDHTIIIWRNKKQMNSIRQRSIEFHSCLRGHQHKITALAASKTYCIIVSGDAAGLLMLWDMNKKCHIRTMKAFEAHVPVRHIAIHPKLGDILVASEIEFKLFSVNGDLLASSSGHESKANFKKDSLEKISCLAWDNRRDDLVDNLLFTGHNNKTIKIWSVSPTSKTNNDIGSSGIEQSSSVWGFAERFVLSTEYIPTCIFKPDVNEMIFTSSIDGKIYAWTLPDGSNTQIHYTFSEICMNCQLKLSVMEKKGNCSWCGGFYCSSCIKPSQFSGTLCQSCNSRMKIQQ